MDECLNKSILRSISVDLAEMIIVLTDDYSMYKTITNNWSSKMYNTTSSLFGLTGLKLRETSRVKRIRDKLTKRIIPSLWWNEESVYRYKISDIFFREYDKPVIISHYRDIELNTKSVRYGWEYKSVFEYGVTIERSNGCPSRISLDERFWTVKSGWYRENDEPSYINFVNHSQYWSRNIVKDDTCTDAEINEKGSEEYDNMEHNSIKRYRVRYCNQRIGNNGENLPVKIELNGMRTFNDDNGKIKNIYIMNFI